MSSSLGDATPEEFVKAVDPSLKFVNIFGGSPRFNLVYQVRRGDDFYVLKAAVKGSSHFKFQTFERDALKECVDVPGITHLVTDYGKVNLDYSAFLKEYVSGLSFYLPTIPHSAHSLLKSELVETVRSLNKKGFFGLDVAPRNLVVSLDFQAITLIDAFYSRKYNELCDDIRFAERLFSEPKSM